MTQDNPLSTTTDEGFALYSRAAVRTSGKRTRMNWELLNREEAKLVQRVFLTSQSGSPRTVVFSGLDRGSGCTTVCARAARNLASQVAGSVCIVDANLRFPALHEYFGVSNVHGFAEVLLQSGPARKFTQQLPDNLWLLTSGFHALDPDSLLRSDRLKPRLSELCDEFDHVLIDTPPLNDFADAISVGQLADGLVLVLEANVTRRETTQKSKEALESASVNLLGAVLNKRTFPIPEVIYRRL